MADILLVDDDTELCSMLAEYLESENFNVDMVHDGLSGVTQARGKNYDAIVLDVMMPEMDGFSVLRELRQSMMTPGYNAYCQRRRCGSHNRP